MVNENHTVIDHGIDSLLTAEFRTWLNSFLGKNISLEIDGCLVPSRRPLWRRPSGLNLCRRGSDWEMCSFYLELRLYTYIVHSRNQVFTITHSPRYIRLTRRYPYDINMYTMTSTPFALTPLNAQYRTTTYFHMFNHKVLL